jgi:hypothetical protein
MAAILLAGILTISSQLTTTSSILKELTQQNMKIFISQHVQGSWQPVTIIGLLMSAFLLCFFQYKCAKLKLL